MIGGTEIPPWALFPLSSSKILPLVATGSKNLSEYGTIANICWNLQSSPFHMALMHMELMHGCRGCLCDDVCCILLTWKRLYV
jgi:hypothetical protein